MPDATTYLVSGFGQGFDMRPMNFKSVVPDFLVCSFCRVACWNEPTGCHFTGSCVDVLRHFEHGCKFHVTSCTNCQARVLRKDVVKHLKSACSAHVIQCADRERP
ncbi:unnamed protein product, partial [Ixodes hexagonus]